MIQRIQTLYLFLAALLMSFLLIFPVARLLGDTTQYELMAFGLKILEEGGTEKVTAVNTWPMGVALIISVLLPLVTIFLYKRRLVQVRLCITEEIFLLGSQALVAFYAYRSVKTISALFSIHALTMSVTAYFPLISMILVWLAMRGIIKDIKLVKSESRIR